MMTEKDNKRKPGRPPKIGGRDVKVYLDDNSIRVAKEIGNGNLSEGVRLALCFIQNSKEFHKISDA